jgi:hypothetical protein
MSFTRDSSVQIRKAMILEVPSERAKDERDATKPKRVASFLNRGGSASPVSAGDCDEPCGLVVHVNLMRDPAEERSARLREPIKSGGLVEQIQDCL